MELDPFNFSGTYAASFTTSFYDVHSFESVHFLGTTDGVGTCQFLWSTDGINTDSTDLTTLYVPPNAFPRILPIRAKYLALTIGGFPPGTTIAIQNLFYEGSAGTFALTNVGGGAEVYKPSSLELRTVTSTDGSITVTQNANTVDVSAAVSFTNLVAATENIKVTEAPAGTFTVDVGRDTAGSLHLGWDTTLAAIGTDSVVLGNGTATTNGNHVVIGGGAPATNTTGASAVDVVIGYRAGNGSSANNSSLNKVFIGGDAGRNAVFNSASGSGHQVFIGNQAGESSTNLEHNIAIGRLAGYGSTKNKDIVAIGAYAGHNSAVGEGAIVIGANCGSGAGIVDGGVYIGKNCGYAMSRSGSNNFHNVLIGDEVGYSHAVSENVVAIGYQAARTAVTAVGSTSVGGQSGYSGVGQETVNIGAAAGYNGSSSYATNVGTSSGRATTSGTGQYAVNLGYFAGTGVNMAAREVNIGASCACTNVAGRLSFGNTMEAVHGSFAVPAANPQAYIKMVWNGVLYYLPAYTTVPT